jgi:hypothetical protein
MNTQLLSLPAQLAASFSFLEQLAINFILLEQQAAAAYLNGRLPSFLNSWLPAVAYLNSCSFSAHLNSQLSSSRNQLSASCFAAFCKQLTFKLTLKPSVKLA